MRSLALVVSALLGYAFLRGWPDFWHPILRICLAVSVLVVAFALWGRAEKSTAIHATPARPPRWLDYLTVGIAVLLVESFFLIFLSTAPATGERLASSFRESLHPEIFAALDQGVTVSDEAPSGFGSDANLATTGNWLFPGLGKRPLNKSGTLRPSNRPEVYLFPKTESDARRLLASPRFLRMFTLATYEKGEWIPDSIIPVAHRGQAGTLVFNDLPVAPITYEISHQPSALGQTLAVTVPELASADLASLRETAPDSFRLPPLDAGQKVYRYQLASVPRPLENLPRPIVPGVSPSHDYLELPADPNLRVRIQALADSLGPPDLATLRKLRQTLRARCEYSLDLDMPPEVDPLESFLFDTKVGYCTHFATATVMLSRALGFPARIAYGWSGGRYFEGPNLFVFRAREAHAWAEIFVRDQGWVIFETTPVDRLEGSASVADDAEPTPFDTHAVTLSKNAQNSPLAPLLKTALCIALGSLVALVIALFLRRPALDPGSPLPAAGILPDPPHYLAVFRRACRLHGVPIPPGRTLRAHLETISAPPFAHDLLAYHYDVHYGSSERDKAREKRLLARLRTWEKEARQSS